MFIYHSIYLFYLYIATLVMQARSLEGLRRVAAAQAWHGAVPQATLAVRIIAIEQSYPRQSNLYAAYMFSVN